MRCAAVHKIRPTLHDEPSGRFRATHQVVARSGREQTSVGSTRVRRDSPRNRAMTREGPTNSGANECRRHATVVGNAEPGIMTLKLSLDTAVPSADMRFHNCARGVSTQMAGQPDVPRCPGALERRFSTNRHRPRQLTRAQPGQTFPSSVRPFAWSVFDLAATNSR